MARAKSKPKRAAVIKPPAAALRSEGEERAPPSKWRLRVLLGLLVLLVCVAIGRWIQDRSVDLPAIPAIRLEGADPEVAAAIENARAALQKEPRSLQAWGKLGMILHANHFPDAALICYSAAGQLDKADPSWLYLQGIVLQNGPKPEQALPYLQQAADLAPLDLTMPRLRFADLHLALGHVEEAGRQFGKVLADHPTDAYARFGLAQVEIARQRDEKALRYLLDAVAEDPHTRKRACALRAALYRRLGNNQAADTERRRFDKTPDDEPWPDAVDQIDELQVGLRGRIRRAEALTHGNQTVEALALMVKTVETYPQSDEAWGALGVAKENVKDFAGAEQAYRRSVDLAPDRSDRRFTLGEFLQGRGRFKEAAEVFRQACKLRPAHAEAYLRIGQCFQALNDKTGAADAYQMALRYRPDLNDARQGLAALNGETR